MYHMCLRHWNYGMILLLISVVVCMRGNLYVKCYEAFI